MSLQERTLVVKNFDPERTTSKLLKELCIQGGPIRNIIVRPDHAFVEYEDIESVGYSKALLDGVVLFGKKLIMEPKLKESRYLKYTRLLNDYIKYDKQQQLQRQQQQQALLYQQQASFMNQSPLPAQPIHPQMQHLMPQPYQQTPPTAVSADLPIQMPHNFSPEAHQHMLSTGSLAQYPANFLGNQISPLFNFDPSLTTQPGPQQFVMPNDNPNSFRFNNNNGNNNIRRARSFNHHQNNGGSRDRWEKRRR